MTNHFNGRLSSLAQITNAESRSISAENFTGEKGKGAMALEGTGQKAARDLGQGWKVSPSISLAPGEVFRLAEIDGPGIIKHFWFTDNADRNRKLILRIYWEGSDTPSVEAPLCDFFACADYQTYAQLTSLPVCVNPGRAFNCFWEMPFRKKCVITLENIHDKDVVVYYQIDYTLTELPENIAYFHAQFRRVNPLPSGEVYTILDNVQGRGQYVGTYLFWGSNNNGWWGEGEVKFYLDGDTDYPTICGTGTEDYFLGSYDFGAYNQYQEYCTPFAGLAKVNRPDGHYISNQRFSMYRWHICDPIYFKKDLRVTIQALGWHPDGRYLPLHDDISSVCFWYQDSVCKSFPALPSADELEII